MNGAAARSLRAGMAQLCLLLLLPIAVQLPRLRTSVTLRRPGTYRSFFSCSSLGALGPRKYSKNRMVPATKEVKGESTPRARTHACTNTRRRAHRCCALAIALALLLSSSLNSGSCHGVPCLPCRALYTHGQPILQISTRKSYKINKAGYDSQFGIVGLLKFLHTQTLKKTQQEICHWFTTANPGRIHEKKSSNQTHSPAWWPENRKAKARACNARECSHSVQILTAKIPMTHSRASYLFFFIHG
jgi:hypothetical protein